jgi:predicted transposase/invertase (TIGR01784 family)
MEKGKAEGKAEGIIDIALRMLSKGMSVAVISEVTGLSVDEIKKLPNYQI